MTDLVTSVLKSSTLSQPRCCRDMHACACACMRRCIHVCQQQLTYHPLPPTPSLMPLLQTVSALSWFMCLLSSRHWSLFKLKIWSFRIIKAQEPRHSRWHSRDACVCAHWISMCLRVCFANMLLSAHLSTPPPLHHSPPTMCTPVHLWIYTLIYSLFLFFSSLNLFLSLSPTLSLNVYLICFLYILYLALLIVLL